MCVVREGEGGGGESCMEGKVRTALEISSVEIVQCDRERIPESSPTLAVAQDLL